MDSLDEFVDEELEKLLADEKEPEDNADELRTLSDLEFEKLLERHEFSEDSSEVISFF